MKKLFILSIFLLSSFAFFSGCSSSNENSGTIHDHTYSENKIAPTCSGRGYILHSCACGSTYEDNYEDALGHSWLEGEKNYYCIKCNCSETDGFTFKLSKMDNREYCYVITDVKSSVVINNMLEVPRKYESLPVREIMYHAFSRIATQVKKIIIHDNIKSVYGDILISDWDTISSLEEIVFDSTCSGMRIEAEAFDNCPKLAKVNIEKGMIGCAPAYGSGGYLFKGTQYFEKNAINKGGLYYIADLLLYVDLKEIKSSVTIDSGTVCIHPYLFRGCTFLKSVTIPDSVTAIGERAFEGCSKLEAITFSGSTKQFRTISFGPDAFENTKATAVICNDGLINEYYYNGWTYFVGG